MLEIFKKSIWRSPVYSAWLSKGGTEKLVFTPPDPWPGEASLGDALFQGRYNFAGQNFYSPKLPVWHPVGMGEAWLADMHGFSWLRHFKARGGETARRHSRALITNWLNQHGNWQAFPWRPDILGRRISAWMTNAGFLLEDADEIFINNFNKLITKQARHLSKVTNIKELTRLSKQLGNQKSSIAKINAVRGLLLTGLCLDGGYRRKEKALYLLNDELFSQISSDGGHKSRTPSLHMSVLADLVTMRDALTAAGEPPPEILIVSIRRMAHALRIFRSGDGALSRFHGGISENKFVVDRVLESADGRTRSKGPLRLEETGFERLVASKVILIADTSPPPSGGHHATHSIEISIGRDRFIGNCGPSFSRDADWDKALSATSAHSTITIENTNAFSGKDKESDAKSHRSTSEIGGDRIDMVHYGYKKRLGVVCKRSIELSDSGRNITGMERIEGPSKKSFYCRFHLAPNVQASLSRNESSVLLKLGGHGWEFSFDGDAKLSIEPSIYITDTGEERHTEQIILSGETKKEIFELIWGLSRS
mgnify:CR=1 FL=1